MLDYGDSRDRYLILSVIIRASATDHERYLRSYYVQLDRYQNELNITRQYAGQKHWPRAVLVRRAR